MILTATMTGISSPDPLQHAFKVKRAPHAGRSGSKPMKVGSALWQQWWQQPTQAKQRALYIHIPFCRKRCSFCNFFENGAKPERIQHYMESLCQQLSIASQTPFAQSQPFDTVYVGGGTPTDASAADIVKLAQVIQQFPLVNNAEITLEGRLNGFDDAKWHNAVENGFNRFSFGVQSFNTEVRRAAGRFDDKDTLLKRLQQLSQHPRTSIVIDLIFGLPGQTVDIWQQDIQAAMQSGVHGIDLYQLIGLGGTRIDKASEKGKILGTETSQFQADSQTRANMYAIGATTLESRHWQRLSGCHWRTDTRERSLYNSLAKSGIEILPFGAGAGGSIHGHGLMNGRDLALWHQSHDEAVAHMLSTDVSIRTLDNLLPQPPQVPAMVLTPNSSVTHDAIFKRGLDSGQLLYSKLGTQYSEHLAPLFSAWQQHGLATLDNLGLTLTLAGRFWNVNMQTGLFEFLAQNPLNANTEQVSDVA